MIISKTLDDAKHYASMRLDLLLLEVLGQNLALLSKIMFHAENAEATPKKSKTNF